MRTLITAAKAPVVYGVGDKVKVKWPEDGVFYPAKIVKPAKKAGSWVIDWDEPGNPNATTTEKDMKLVKTAPRSKLAKALDTLIHTKDPLIGTSWVSPDYGKRTVLRGEMRGGKSMYWVDQENSRTQDLLSADDIAMAQKRDAANTISRARDRAAQVMEENERLLRTSLNGFTKGMTPLQRGQAEKFLLGSAINIKGKVFKTKAAAIESLVAAGYTTEDMGDRRVMMAPNDTFFEGKHFTQMGLAYADHLAKLPKAKWTHPAQDFPSSDPKPAAAPTAGSVPKGKSTPTSKKPVEDAIEPMKAQAIERAARDAQAIVDRTLKELADVGWDANVMQRYPTSFNMGREEYLKQKNKYNRARAFVQPVENYPRPGAPHIMVKDQRRIDKFIKDSQEAAAAQYEAFVHKLVNKIGPDVTSAVLTGSHVWGSSILTVTKKDGSVERWKTQQIVNMSKLGTLFNQWPSRKVK